MATAKKHPVRTIVPVAKRAKTAKAEKTSKTAGKPSGRKPSAKALESSGAGKSSRQKARKPASLPKSDGDAGVQAFLASMEPWQAAIARRVDALVVKHVPGVRKGMRWRCPFYGVEGQGWFLAFAAFQFHVKFTFFLGTSLEPVPPVGQDKTVRSLDVREPDAFDEKRMASWIQQAAAIPGWDGGSPRNGGVPL